MKNAEVNLQSKGIRPTAMRLLVFKYLSKEKNAKSLSDIEEAFAKAERTTVYRTLKTFEDKGVAHQIDDGTGISKYALCAENCNAHGHADVHLHFHCNKCNQTQCLTEQKIPQIKLPEGYIAEDLNLIVKGICEECNT